MKKISIFIVVIVILVSGFYILNNDTRNEKQDNDLSQNFKEVTFWISGEPIKLIDGRAQAITSLGGASETVIHYFGNEVSHDIDGDGVEDIVFLVTQETGGSGTFFYAVGALKRDAGYTGTNAVYIGDRIAPQTTEKGEGRQVVINYADRLPGEPMTAQPSVGKSIIILLDVDSLQFGEVIQDFEGEER